MNTKKCFKCQSIKPLSYFYKHNGMADGYLGKCKECTKKDTSERLEFNMKNIDGFQDMERARHRDKYYRLGYKEKHKKTPEKKKEYMYKYKNKYPEKSKAKNLSQRIPCEKGNHLHHWSYNIKDAKDCIELNPKHHNLIHRFIDYDQSTFMYKDLNGNLLDTKEKHLTYINSIIEKRLHEIRY